jgi:hypothetical protein
MKKKSWIELFILRFFSWCFLYSLFQQNLFTHTRRKEWGRERKKTNIWIAFTRPLLLRLGMDDCRQNGAILNNLRFRQRKGKNQIIDNCLQRPFSHNENLGNRWRIDEETRELLSIFYRFSLGEKRNGNMIDCDEHDNPSEDRIKLLISIFMGKKHPHLRQTLVAANPRQVGVYFLGEL